jgi:hypothetical protein
MIILGLFVWLVATSIQSDLLFLAIHLVQYAPDIRHTSAAFYMLDFGPFLSFLFFEVFLAEKDSFQKDKEEI